MTRSHIGLPRPAALMIALAIAMTAMAAQATPVEHSDGLAESIAADLTAAVQEEGPDSTTDILPSAHIAIEDVDLTLVGVQAMRAPDSGYMPDLAYAPGVALGPDFRTWDMVQRLAIALGFGGAACAGLIYKRASCKTRGPFFAPAPVPALERRQRLIAMNRLLLSLADTPQTTAFARSDCKRAA